MQCLCLPVLRGCTLSLSSGSSPPPAGNGSATQQYMPFGWFQYRRMCYLPAAAVGAVKKITKCSVLGIFSKIVSCLKALPSGVWGKRSAIRITGRCSRYEEKYIKKCHTLLKKPKNYSKLLISGPLSNRKGHGLSVSKLRFAKWWQGIIPA